MNCQNFTQTNKGDNCNCQLGKKFTFKPSSQPTSWIEPAALEIEVCKSLNLGFQWKLIGKFRRSTNWFVSIDPANYK